jgi:FkbM family methyltransferase
MTWRTGLQNLTRVPAIRRTYDFFGNVPLLRSALRTIARAAIPRHTFLWFRVSSGLAEGLWVRVDPRFEMIYVDGEYEPTIQRILSQNLKPGFVFYDVGAHIGIVSMIGARLVGSEGEVFAFEAEPENTGRIEEHVRRNDLRQIQVVPRAVWSSSGTLRFSRASTQSSRNQGAVASNQSTEGGNVIEVPAVALDDFVKEHHLPTLIKIDVEGAEAQVLRGSEEVFARTKPVVICEVHHSEAAEDVGEWFLKRNYSIEWLEDSRSFPRHLVATWRG